MKDKMTSRERVMTALGHKETDRVPFSHGMGINKPVREELAKYLGMDSEQEFNNYFKSLSDIQYTGPDYCGPSSRNTIDKEGRETDIWGVVREPVSYGKGSYNEICHYPLGDIKDIKELDSFQWPTTEWWDVSKINDKIKQINSDNEYAITIGNGNIYETSWYMRGFEQMFLDLAINPELAYEIMKRVTDYYISYFKMVLEAADGMIDIVFTADDIGQQQGLLISLDMWEKMIKPHHQRLNKVLHDYGVKIMYHSDGAIMEAVPGLIDMGIDVLEALQFEARGMDPRKLKDNYGDKLCFHGGVSVQQTLPHGAPEEVKEEVKARIGVLGENGGYILAPSHAIQAGTPPENVIAFLEAAGVK
ncbi:MAG: uroporphyrinogen decarboxylase family protein [bacterium]